MTDDRIAYVRRTPLALLGALAVASLLDGCGMLHRHFDHKDTEYRQATESRPLEVPPDLDTPSSSSALVIPPAGTAAPAAAAGATPVVAVPSGGTVPAAAPPAVEAVAGASLVGDGLVVNDGADSTWSRVGLALERSGAASIVSRDEAGHSYVVATTGQTSSRAGWFKRAITLGHAGNKTTARVQLTVRVTGEGSGSRVSIEGASDEASRDAAHALLDTLRQRLS
jgi:uncharacterized lipoprotein